MNKTQIRNALDKLKREKLDKLLSAYNLMEERREIEVLDEFVSGSQLVINSELKKLRDNKSIKIILASIKEIDDVVSKHVFLNHPYGATYMKQTLNRIVDGMEEYNVNYIPNEWKCRDCSYVQPDIKMYNDYKDKKRKIENEFLKLDRYLIKTTAKEFYNFLLSNGINIDIDNNSVKKELPALNISVDLII